VKRYRVVLSPRAFRQLGDLEHWIEEAAGVEVARRYRQAIVDHCLRLAQFPNRGSFRHDLRADMRTIVYRGRVTVAYVVAGDEVQITAVVGRGRDIAAALDD
jgi:plasmid stabilization system protein ParE